MVFYLSKYGGIRRYFSEIIKRISLYDDTRVELFTGFNILPRRLARFNRAWLNYKLKTTQYDVYHPTYYSPNVIKRKNAKTVVTVYDMIHEMGLMKYPGIEKEIEIKKRSILNADYIICISRTTQQDLEKIYNINNDRVSVIYLASFSINGKKKSNKETDISKRPYIFYVGNRDFYKNFKILLAAFHQLNLKKDFDLVCFGGRKFSQEENNEFKRLGLDRIVKRISGDDYLLQQYYDNAYFFIHTSYYEGFGLSILESMDNGCPVIASRSGSVVEIAGDAALFFSPDNVDELCASLKTIIGNNAIRDEYIKKGRERVKNFSWDKTALETYSVYKKVLNNT